MRFLRNIILAMFMVAVAAPLARGDLILSISSINPIATGGSFRVKAQATSDLSFNAYGLKLQATAFLGGISLPITMTSETNLLPNFAQLTGPFDHVPNNTIANVGDQFGMSAFSAIPFAMTTGPMVEVAQFTFAVADLSFDPGEAWDVAFVTTNPNLDTGFNLGGVNIPLTAMGARINAVPEPSTLAFVGIAAAMALRWRRRRKGGEPSPVPDPAVVPSLGGEIVAQA
jgi:hypothetical protein